MTSIEAEGLSKVYCDGKRNLEIIKNVSLKIEEATGVAIYGPSGSGKTTLLNLLSGLDRPTKGSVKLNGTLLGTLSDDKKSNILNRDVGFVFQFYHLLPELTAIENVMVPGLVNGAMERVQCVERAKKLLKKMGLENRMGHFPDELSGGEQQRTAIARALMNDPKILFCDEPTGNLDLAMGEEIAAFLRDLFVKEKKTVVIVTHDERIAKIADKVWNMLDNQWETKR